MISGSNKAFIIDAKRTPFGRFGGSLMHLPPVELAYRPARAILDGNKIKADDVDQVIFANVIPSTPDTLYGGRHLALRLNLPIKTPGIVINRLCGSGIQAILDAAKFIRYGEDNLILVAGAENLSMAPHLTYGARFGTKYGGLKSQDLLLDTLTDKLSETPMGITAENLAQEYHTGRIESDAFSLRSHHLATKAYQEQLIQPEIISLSGDKLTCSKDEHLREDCSLEDLTRLKPTFKKDGVVTAGSASGIVDGGAAMLVASESYIKNNSIKPLAEIVDGFVIGVDPLKMGIGPVPAIEILLKRNNLSLNDIDLFEINEAFAPQVLACQKALNIEPAKLNIWGGAVALGHPLGATGIKITMTLARQLVFLNKTLGIASACIGGGQGIAVLIRRI